MNNNDTICAISTPPGEGGITVIRISGVNTFPVIENLFYKDIEKKSAFDVSEVKSHTIHFGYLFESEKLIDEVLVSVFKNPNSYTGEDVIEISSHGGSFLARKIITILLDNKCRLAEPGEFTKRAFLNGRIDLSQAEAVADLIKAKTDLAHSASIKQLEGSLSEFVKNTRQDIINYTSLIELELDFAEEDVEFVKKTELKSKIENLILHLQKMIDSYIVGKVIRDGVNLVIAGKPNSGKSSLFNYLLRTNRAIVSNIPGTTRDYIEENVIIEGVLFNLTDTAGLRISEDVIENEGIKRSHGKIEEADLILYLIDSSIDENSVKDSLKYCKENLDKKIIIPVFTKIDIAKTNIVDIDILKISLLKDNTIETLKSEMVKKVLSGKSGNRGQGIILTNLRHKTCLENVIKSLEESVKSINRKVSGEFISVDLRNALNHLGEITGEVTNEDILNNIFLRFCIGK